RSAQRTRGALRTQSSSQSHQGHQGGVMRTLPAAAESLAVSGLTSNAAMADRDRDEEHHNDRVNVAVFGDWPYNQLLLDNASLLVDPVNADRDVSLVIH